MLLHPAFSVTLDARKVREEIIERFDVGHLCNHIEQLEGPLQIDHIEQLEGPLQIDRTPARDIYEDLRLKNQTFGDFPKLDNWRGKRGQ